MTKPRTPANSDAPRAPRARKKQAPSLVWVDAFLRAYSESGVVTEAAQMANVDRSTVYDLKERDPEFARRVVAAREQAIEFMEAELFRRSVVGWDEPQFGRVGRDQDGEIGMVRKYSDRLLELRLRALKPEVYREKVTIHHLTTDALDAELQRLAAEIEKLGGEVPVE